MSRLCNSCKADISASRARAVLCSACRQSRMHDPAPLAAHTAVARARRHGQLADPKTLACADCGGVADRYDHRDYSKPLDVEPVCRKCNGKRGPAIDSPAADSRKERQLPAVRSIEASVSAIDASSAGCISACRADARSDAASCFSSTSSCSRSGECLINSTTACRSSMFSPASLEIARRKSASVAFGSKNPIVALLAVVLVAVGAAVFLTAQPSDSQLTAAVLVGRS